MMARHSSLLLTLLIAIPAVRCPAQPFEKVGDLSMTSGQATGRPGIEVDVGTPGLIVVSAVFPSFEIWEHSRPDETWTLFSFPGCAYTGPPGRPMVATLTHILKLGRQEQILLENISIDWSAKPYHGSWYPTQPPSADGSPSPDWTQDPATYAAEVDVLTPDRVSLGPLRHHDGTGYATLSIRPFSYRPQEGEVAFAKRVTVTIRRIGGQAHSPGGQAPRAPDLAGNSSQNLGNVGDTGASESDPPHAEKPHPGYLIITPASFQETLRPLINFKRKTHPDLEIALVEDIGAQVSALDAFIENRCRRGTRDVLLVGHPTRLPSAEYEDPFDEDDVLDCLDRDAVYRNMGDEELPTIRVGRLPVVDTSELEILVEKTLQRLRHPTSFLKRITLVGHEDGAPGGYQGCVSRIRDFVLSESRIDIQPTFIFPAARDRGGLDSRLEDLHREFRRGMNLLFYRGHGGPDFFSSGLLDSFGLAPEHWTENPARAVPILFSVACWNGVCTLPGGVRAGGLCEKLLTSSVHGFSGAIGSITPGSTAANQVFAQYLMYYTYVDPQGTIGEIHRRAVIDTVKHGLSREDWTTPYLAIGDLYNVYGDPELPVVVSNAPR